jgi:hypothetical protein
MLDLTATASLGAARPPTPGGDLAVDRARVSVARRNVFHGRAKTAAVGGRASDVTYTGLRTTAAEDGTETEARPLSDHAVDGAVVGVARLGFRGCRTCNAAVLSMDYDGAGVRHGVTTAGLRAVAPAVPEGDDTIDRTRIGVAGQ